MYLLFCNHTLHRIWFVQQTGKRKKMDGIRPQIVGGEDRREHKGSEKKDQNKQRLKIKLFFFSWDMGVKDKTNRLSCTYLQDIMSLNTERQNTSPQWFFSGVHFSVVWMEIVSIPEASQLWTRIYLSSVISRTHAFLLTLKPPRTSTQLHALRAYPAAHIHTQLFNESTKKKNNEQ